MNDVSTWKTIRRMCCKAFLVAGPGIAPGSRDYEPRVVTTPPPRVDMLKILYINYKKLLPYVFI